MGCCCHFWFFVLFEIGSETWSDEVQWSHTLDFHEVFCYISARFSTIVWCKQWRWSRFKGHSNFQGPSIAQISVYHGDKRHATKKYPNYPLIHHLFLWGDNSYILWKAVREVLVIVRIFVQVLSLADIHLLLTTELHPDIIQISIFRHPHSQGPVDTHSRAEINISISSCW